jgi:hypothetical protein
MTQLAYSDPSSLEDIIELDPAIASGWARSLPQRLAEDDPSSESLEYEDRKARLRMLIDSMVHGAPSWDGEPAFVSVESAATALRFLAALPPKRPLPLVAADGEGSILLVWEPPSGNCIITVDKDVLHLLDKPGTPSVEHVDDQSFLGWRIPVAILHRIPLR